MQLYKYLDFTKMEERKKEFIESIKGLALLDSLRSEKIKKIVTTSYDSQDLALFCTAKLEADMVFHKWEDEDKIIELFVEESK